MVSPSSSPAGVAGGTPGVNTNVLSPGHLVDEISGNAMVNGFEVSVTAAG